MCVYILYFKIISIPQAEPDANIANILAAVRDATALLRALAHDGRLPLLCRIGQGAIPAGALEALPDIRQPGLSRQPYVQRARNLVTIRRKGKRIHDPIADPEAPAILGTPHALYCPAT